MLTYLQSVEPVISGEYVITRSFSDYEVTIDEANLPDGITLIRRI